MVRTNSMTRRALASSLALVILSCSGPRYSAVGPSGPHDLHRYVLVIQETPGGGVEHEWRHLKEFRHAGYQGVSQGGGFHGQVRTVALTADECRQQYYVCLPTCEASTRILQVGNYVYDSKRWGPWRTGKWLYCKEACMEQLANCEKHADREPRRFEAIEPAVDWVKENRNEILVGAVIVIAGVAFVAVLVGTGGGSLALVPLVLMVSAEQSPGTEQGAVHP
jgi:hypothetical protein